jgi:hypothetical protein
MIKKDIDSERHKLSVPAKDDKNNDQVTNCRICASNGWPHEPIDFQQIQGRMLSDGTRETVGWKLKNYYTGQQHKHKEPKQKQQSSGRYYMEFDLKVLF